jgi:hypothetical protein
LKELRDKQKELESEAWRQFEALEKPMLSLWRETSGEGIEEHLPRPPAPAAFGSPFLACASDAIPFRTNAVAESTGIHGHKGEQPFRATLPDSACETPFPRRKPVTRRDSRREADFRPDPVLGLHLYRQRR